MNKVIKMIESELTMLQKQLVSEYEKFKTTHENDDESLCLKDRENVAHLSGTIALSPLPYSGEGLEERVMSTLPNPALSRRVAIPSPEYGRGDWRESGQLLSDQVKLLLEKRDEIERQIARLQFEYNSQKNKNKNLKKIKTESLDTKNEATLNQISRYLKLFKRKLLSSTRWKVKKT